jgi:hypothetical protein
MSNISPDNAEVVMMPNMRKRIVSIGSEPVKEIDWHVHITILGRPGWEFAKEISQYLKKFPLGSQALGKCVAVIGVGLH